MKVLCRLEHLDAAKKDCSQLDKEVFFTTVLIKHFYKLVTVCARPQRKSLCLTLGTLLLNFFVFGSLLHGMPSEMEESARHTKI